MAKRSISQFTKAEQRTMSVIALLANNFDDPNAVMNALVMTMRAFGEQEQLEHFTSMLALLEKHQCEGRRNAMVEHLGHADALVALGEAPVM